MRSSKWSPMVLKGLLIGIVAVGLAFATVTPAQADSFSFTGTINGETVDATAEFTIVDGTGPTELEITLTNNIELIHSIQQAISGLSWVVYDSDDNMVAIDPISITSQDGRLITFDDATPSDHTATDIGDAGDDALSWGLTGGDAFLNALGFAGSGLPPDELIIGLPDSGTDLTYSNANPSIRNAAHQPVVQQTATFHVTIGPAWDDSWSFGDVVMYFGTNGAPVSAPEPGTLLLLCTGLLGVGLAKRRMRVLAN